MRFLAFVGALAIIVGIGAAVFFLGGFYNVAATAEDPAIVRWALIQTRTASINRHATDQPPANINDAQAVQAGAKAFAERFPWVQLYTPVNEMFICATFSARYGWWNEQCTTDRTFVTALNHIVRANVKAMEAILNVRPDAIFIQSESSEYFHS